MSDVSSKKDFWDKLDALSGVLSFVSVLAIAGVGWWFTNGYKERESRLSELEVTSKMIPFLEDGGRKQQAALIAMSALGRTELATRFATLYGGDAAVQATAMLARHSPEPSDAATAKRTLNAFTKTGRPKDAVAAAVALAAINNAVQSEKLPAEQIVVVSSGPKLSGSGKNFNATPYELCGEAPPGYTVASADFRLTGDRSCGAWAECRESSRTPQRVCWQFKMQGHDEWAAPGQGQSEGVLRIVATR